MLLDHDPTLVPSTWKLAPKEKPQPTRELLTMGQTNKKFMVVPVVDNLLEAIEEEEKMDKQQRDQAREAAKKAKAEPGA